MRFVLLYLRRKGFAAFAFEHLLENALYVFTAFLYMALVARLHFYLWQEGRRGVL